MHTNSSQFILKDGDFIPLGSNVVSSKLIINALFNPPSLTSSHVLLVEDEAVTRTALTVLLEYQGAVVVAAGSIAHATRAIATGFEPDLLLTNIRLPDGNGAQVLYALRRQDEQLGRYTPAIALTGEVFEIIRVDYDAAGFQLYVEKPFDSQRLLKDIDRLLRERRRYSEG